MFLMFIFLIFFLFGVFWGLFFLVSSDLLFFFVVIFYVSSSFSCSLCILKSVTCVKDVCMCLFLGTCDVCSDIHGVFTKKNKHSITSAPPCLFPTQVTIQLAYSPAKECAQLRLVCHASEL